MASAPIQKTYLSAVEYLALERQAEIKSEYIDGEMVAMTGGTWLHGVIIGNLVFALKRRLQDTPCTVIPNDVKVRASPGIYAYPDVLVVCGEPLIEDGEGDVLLNPVLIVEVLSPTTESYDRGRKFENYQTLDSLKEYVLVAQDRPRVEHYLRQDGHVWLYTDVSGLDSSVAFSSIGCEVALAEIYDKVTFP
ncbi:MAG TPA: Uma2 family endonuclease [Thermoanaerobaculia bacterium]|nr:Uma2 family endonuclease [Thermoanaerobaculia bacterium]